VVFSFVIGPAQRRALRPATAVLACGFVSGALPGSCPAFASVVDQFARGLLVGMIVGEVMVDFEKRAILVGSWPRHAGYGWYRRLHAVGLYPVAQVGQAQLVDGTMPL